MKLGEVLDRLNSFEKNSFLKIIDNLISEKTTNWKDIEAVLNKIDGGLKDADNVFISEIFGFLEDEYLKTIYNEFSKTVSQLDILIDIVIRDGNCLQSRDWFLRLYEDEIKMIISKVNTINKIVVEGSKNIEPNRIRDYRIYRACVSAAYFNDLENNQDPKITQNEQSIINALTKQLGLSHEEIRLLNYSVIKLQKKDIDETIRDLKNVGIIFYSKKSHQLYIPDEFVALLRRLRGKEVADKHFRRILKNLKDSQINLIARKHNIDRKLARDVKINQIIKEGVHFSEVLLDDIHKDGTKMTEIKSMLNDIIENDLKIKLPVKGVTAQDKVTNLINHFNQIDKEETISISKDGYEKLLLDIHETLPEFNNVVKTSFYFQAEHVLRSNYLLDYNLKPRDILYLMTNSQIREFCTARSISIRGDEISNILKQYKDSENLYLENYDAVGRRDLKTLKENGIAIKESELGVKFENITKNIFNQLGFNVDEDLRKKVNTKRDKIDIILGLGNDDVMIVECKSIKDRDFNSYSSVSRQIKAYIQLAEKNGFKVTKSLLVAPEFSDEFENECGLEYELNLSLITASSLKNILDGFKKSRHKQFPYKLLLRDVLIKEERILKAMSK